LLQRLHPFVYFEGIWLKRGKAGEVENISVPVDIRVDETGYRKIPRVAKGAKEDHKSRLNFLKYFKGRSMNGVRLFISDKCPSLVEALGEVYPESKWQKCVLNSRPNCN